MDGTSSLYTQEERWHSTLCWLPGVKQENSERRLPASSSWWGAGSACRVYHILNLRPTEWLLAVASTSRRPAKDSLFPWAWNGPVSVPPDAIRALRGPCLFPEAHGQSLPRSALHYHVSGWCSCSFSHCGRSQGTSSCTIPEDVIRWPHTQRQEMPYWHGQGNLSWPWVLSSWDGAWQTEGYSGAGVENSQGCHRSAKLLGTSYHLAASKQWEKMKNIANG